MSSRHELNND